jgi:hypothetical protein
VGWPMFVRHSHLQVRANAAGIVGSSWGLRLPAASLRAPGAGLAALPSRARLSSVSISAGGQGGSYGPSAAVGGLDDRTAISPTRDPSTGTAAPCCAW